jgi:uncharacterized surface protein with fasciclin (FAS1) repeats
MNRSRIMLALSTVALLALPACEKAEPGNPAATAKENGKEGSATTIAAGLPKDSRFMAAAKAAGIDATLAGPGPYTVLVPDDAAFNKLPAGTLDNLMKPESRGQLSSLLTYHIMPGTVLAADIGKAIDAGKGKAQLATMGGEVLTATKDGGKIVLTDAAGNKASIVGDEVTRSNGVVHQVDAVLMPRKA